MNVWGAIVKSDLSTVMMTHKMMRHHSRARDFIQEIKDHINYMWPGYILHKPHSVSSSKLGHNVIAQYGHTVLLRNIVLLFCGVMWQSIQ